MEDIVPDGVLYAALCTDGQSDLQHERPGRRMDGQAKLISPGPTYVRPWRYARKICGWDLQQQHGHILPDHSHSPLYDLEIQGTLRPRIAAEESHGTEELKGKQTARIVHRLLPQPSGVG